MTTNTAQPSIGIITIATGEYYRQFIPTLKRSIDAYFNQSSPLVQFYCFTDTVEDKSNQAAAAIVHFPVHPVPWPFATLMRYQWILQQWEVLRHHSHLLYMDADMEVVRSIPATAFMAELFAVVHPGYLGKPGAFEPDRTALSYLAPPLRKTYYQGCLWGGKMQAFGDLVQTLAKQVSADLRQGQIALWHDESHLNWYLAQHPCHALPTSYAWPSLQMPKDSPFILHLEKPHDAVRQVSVDGIEIERVMAGQSAAEELAMYRRLYLVAHEKNQRLAARLQTEGWWSRLRETLSFYKNTPPANE